MYGRTNAGGRPVNAAQLRIFCQQSTPTNPKHGDIFVVSSVPCSGGEFTPYDIQPGRVDQGQIGYVFVDINTGGNAIEHPGWLLLAKKPNIILSAYFTSVVQKLEDGAYHAMTAYIYDTNSWYQISAEAPPWDGTLFYNGDQYTDHTGGWGYASSNSNAPSFGSSIWWSFDNTTMFVYTSRAIDVTKYSRLRYTGQMWGDASFGLANKNGWGLIGSNWVARITNPVNSTKYDGSVDISGVSGSFYVVAYASAEGGSGALFDKIWLE